ncbi:hypothetical protein O9G_003940 [Rozella allomycis CSF55]|uniref:Uncharacterized protein n=1 Tax=Rozella allomycis (strain CSF55) TaxID=988480 RepID=A0A075APT4_ROZAC|nr:hypothetical protein O9G_003940 [Rozella allomycis CSF55]|eukprot:EPZ32093.1 hypothetical protein O9G_003940 [Rozella allomycis CSF55]
MGCCFGKPLKSSDSHTVIKIFYFKIDRRAVGSIEKRFKLANELDSEKSELAKIVERASESFINIQSAMRPTITPSPNSANQVETLRDTLNKKFTLRNDSKSSDTFLSFETPFNANIDEEKNRSMIDIQEALNLYKRSIPNDLIVEGPKGL